MPALDLRNLALRIMSGALFDRAVEDRVVKDRPVKEGELAWSEGKRLNPRLEGPWNGIAAVSRGRFAEDIFVEP